MADRTSAIGRLLRGCRRGCRRAADGCQPRPGPGPVPVTVPASSPPGSPPTPEEVVQPQDPAQVRAAEDGKEGPEDWGRDGHYRRHWYSL